MDREIELKQFQTALNNSQVTTWEQDEELRYRWLFNPSLGFRTDDVLGKTDEELLDPCSAEALKEIKLKVLDGSTEFAVLPLSKHGEREVHVICLKPVIGEGGQVVGISGTSARLPQDVDEAASLKVAEANHRIANNLARIASLLRIRRHQSADGSAEALAVAEAQIASVAELHRALINAPAAMVDLAQHLDSTLRHLGGCGAVPERTKIVLECPSGISLGAGVAQTLELVMIELVLNSIKYACNGGSGVVNVLVVVDDALHLHVWDEGPGLPPEFDLHRAGMGTAIVAGLVSQLGGHAFLEERQGRRLAVEIPPP